MGEGGKGKNRGKGKIKYGRESLRIVVHVNGDMERKLKGLRGWMEGKEDGTWTIIGDFNVRTGGGEVE